MIRPALAALMLLSAPPALACGADSDCSVAGGRTYRVDLPEGAPRGAILFAHGYRGSAAGTMRNGGLRRLATERGLALVALDARDTDWDLPNAPRRVDEDGAEETAYVEAVVADIADRFDVPADRLLMTGFSAGGMFVWNVACARPGLFQGFVAVSGTFWGAPEEDCRTPVADLLHIHGTADRTVPLDGRPIADTRQGRVADAMAMYGALGGFGAEERAEMMDGLDCAQSENAAGARLALCLHDGGHSFRNEFVAMGWDWAERN